jgi:glutamate/tyrosine decarboxylase-like PLP-dependent enzyme
VIFANPEVGKFYKHDSPYTYFSSKDLHLGEISLECSRAGASAVALYATQQLLPCVDGGAFANQINTCANTARWMYNQLKESEDFISLIEPELDIILWSLKGESAADISRKNVLFFEKCAEKNLHLALYQVRTNKLPPSLASIIKNENHVTVLRSCLMKPEHWDWKERIWAIMEAIEY